MVTEGNGKAAWEVFRSVVDKFLAIRRAENYDVAVNELPTV